MNTIDQVFSLLFFARFVFSLACVLYDVIHRRRSEKPLDPSLKDLPLVSILVPAYNEGRVIRGTVESALRSDYPNLEIIIIDDGSTDDTYAVSTLLADDHERIKVVAQRPNQGKAAALNAGIKNVSGDIFVSIDADTVVSEDCVRYIVSPVIRNKADAVAGNIKIGNRLGTLQQWQSVEHITGLNFDRRVQATIGTITCIPGAAGAFRRSAVKQVGGYSSDTSVEDSDLSIALLRAGFSIDFEPRALAYTEAPATLQALTHQRTRWENGKMHCLWKHRHALFCLNWLGLYEMPNALFLHFLTFPFAFYCIFKSSMPNLFVLQTWISIIAPVFALDVTVGAFTLWIDGESLTDVRHIPLRKLIWPFFQLFIFCRVIVRALLRRTCDWNKLVRTGELADAVISGRKADILNKKV